MMMSISIAHGKFFATAPRVFVAKTLFRYFSIIYLSRRAERILRRDIFPRENAQISAAHQHQSQYIYNWPEISAKLNCLQQSAGLIWLGNCTVSCWICEHIWNISSTRDTIWTNEQRRLTTAFEEEEQNTRNKWFMLHCEAEWSTNRFHSNKFIHIHFPARTFFLFCVVHFVRLLAVMRSRSVALNDSKKICPPIPFSSSTSSWNKLYGFRCGFTFRRFTL